MLRDLGHARDFVEMQWLMLQQKKPEDYVIATGKQYKVRDFIIWSCNSIGLEIEFQGKGINEIVIVINNKNDLAPNIKIGDIIIKVDKIL